MQRLAPGMLYHPGYLSPAEQLLLCAEIERAVELAPYFTPLMPRTGRPFSVRMSNLGELGWVSDRAGYRYEAHHPDTGRPWPPMPAALLAIWRAVAGYPREPEACLVNHYREGARMGLHRDADEEDLAAPVVSVSLGDTAVFRFGGTARGGPTATLKLASGDVLVIGGPSRLCHHGIDRVLSGTSRLLPEGGRINLTMRRVRL